jgi:hypothetical protein
MVVLKVSMICLGDPDLIVAWLRGKSVWWVASWGMWGTSPQSWCANPALCEGARQSRIVAAACCCPEFVVGTCFCMCTELSVPCTYRAAELRGEVEAGAAEGCPGPQMTVAALGRSSRLLVAAVHAVTDEAFGHITR